MRLLASQGLPNPDYFAGWENVGIVGILVAAIVYVITGTALFIRAIYQGQLWTERRAEDMREHFQGVIADKDEDIASRDRIIADLQRTVDTMQRHAERRDQDFDRVLSESKALLHDVVMAGLRPRDGS